jgi:hypothetical protein
MNFARQYPESSSQIEGMEAHAAVTVLDRFVVIIGDISTILFTMKNRVLCLLPIPYRILHVWNLQMIV